jgi:hypothetical protein
VVLVVVVEVDMQVELVVMEYFEVNILHYNVLYLGDRMDIRKIV